MTEHSPIGWLKGHVDRANSGVTEAEARLSMADVIRLGSRSLRSLEVKHKGCPFCGSDPLPAARVCGRYVVACEAEDCQADVQAAGASPEEAWKIWDARI